MKVGDKVILQRITCEHSNLCNGRFGAFYNDGELVNITDIRGSTCSKSKNNHKIQTVSIQSNKEGITQRVCMKALINYNISEELFKI